MYIVDEKYMYAKSMSSTCIIYMMYIVYANRTLSDIGHEIEWFVRFIIHRLWQGLCLGKIVPFTVEKFRKFPAKLETCSRLLV